MRALPARPPAVQFRGGVAYVRGTNILAIRVFRRFMAGHGFMDTHCPADLVAGVVRWAIRRGQRLSRNPKRKRARKGRR